MLIIHDVRNTDKKSLQHPDIRVYVIAVGRPIYEIRGSAFYKTDGGCTQEIINPMRKQLPGFVQTEMCPEGSSRYACNVVVVSSKCSEDEVYRYFFFNFFFSSLFTTCRHFIVRNDLKVWISSNYREP